MFSYIIRPIIRCPLSFTSVRHKSQNIIPNIKEPIFWEEDSRPIPNTADAMIHAVTQKNQHIDWERSHERLVLIGEVVTAATKGSLGMSRVTNFILKTTIITEETVGYKVLEQFHYIFVMQETLRQKVLRTFLPGTPMMIFAGIHYRMREDPKDISLKFFPVLFLEEFTGRMAHNYLPSNTMGQNKGLLQDLQNKRQKMENITRHMLNHTPTSSMPSLVSPPIRPGPILSFTNNSLPAPKPKPLKTEEKSLRSQMNEALTFAERTSSGYYVGNASPYGNLLIPAIPRLNPPKDNSFRETRLPRDSI